MSIVIDQINPFEKIVAGLQLLVADLYALTILSQNLHWNIEGPNFDEYHSFFGSEYEANVGEIDGYAEQIRQLGSYAKADLSVFKLMAGMPEIEAPFTPVAAFTTLKSAYDKFYKDLENLKNVTGQLNDLNTQQMVIDSMMRVSKSQWKIRSILK